MSDLRHAFRSLLRNPGLTTAAIVSLALGIGANTAIFSLADQMLLRLLPVKSPRELVLLGWKGAFIGGTSRGAGTFSYPAFSELQELTPGSMAGIAATYQERVDLGDKSLTEAATAELVSGNYFDVLGVKPELGRTFTAEDDRLGKSEAVAVLSYEFWRRRFGANPGVLNRTMQLNGRPVLIVGVTQKGFPGFRTLSLTNIFVPLAMKATVTPTWNDMERRNSVWLQVFGRLKPGVTRAAAKASLGSAYHATLEHDLAAVSRPRQFQERYRNNSIEVEDASQGFTDQNQYFARPITLLMIMVGTLLAIACVNVANLLITRSASRQKEIAIRLSLGASRGALMKMVMSESLLLAAAGGVIGIVMSIWVTSLLIEMIPIEQLSTAIRSTPDLRILGFSAALTLATALLFGLAPAMECSRPDVTPVLKAEGGSVSASRAKSRLRAGLVVLQVTLSIVMLAGAGLFSKSLYNVFSVDSGLAASRLLTFTIDPSRHNYPADRAKALYLEIQRAAGPASAASFPLLANVRWENTAVVEGYTPKEGEDMQAGWNQVLPGFFSATGVPLIAGREFTERDSGGKIRSAIVNQAFVKRFFKDGNALGRHIGFGGPPNIEIVGVVRDVKSGDLREEVNPRTWTPALEDSRPGSMTFYVRTPADPRNSMMAVLRAVQKLDPALPVQEMKTLEAQIGETHFVERIFALLAVAFGGLATLLAGVGLFGITAHSVARRTHEIGIRMALGADRKDVLGIVAREVAAVIAVGVGIGLPLAVTLGRLLESQLFGVKGWDPLVVLGSVAVISISALAAAYLPARRAMNVEPLRALRYE